MRIEPACELKGARAWALLLKCPCESFHYWLSALLRGCGVKLESTVILDDPVRAIKLLVQVYGTLVAENSGYLFAGLCMPGGIFQH